MVGAKSLGCLECKRRKVKCDQRYPVCRNCERLNRSCSSPKSPFIRFVRPGSEEHINTTNTTITFHPTKPTKPKRITHHHYQPQTSFIYPSTTVSERLSTDLIHHLSNIDKVGYQLQWFGVFLSFLPSRIGHNKALDAAVRCLLQAHHAMLCDRDIATEGLESYNDSIVLIRRDLCDQQARTTSETVCAALILSTYEVYKREQCQSWMMHAGGVAAILQSWGPERFVSDFELALFASHYGSTISSSILSGKPCFLALPEWQNVLTRCLHSFPTMDRYAMDCMMAFTTLPALLCMIRDFRAQGRGRQQDDKTESEDESQDYESEDENEDENEDEEEDGYEEQWPPATVKAAQEFKSCVARHSLRFHRDYLDPRIVLKTPLLPCSHPPSLSTTTAPYTLQFNTPSTAFRYNFYWAITIISNTILLSLHPRSHPSSSLIDLIHENEQAATNISASMEYLHTLKPLGALWLTFVAAMAYGVTSDEENKKRIVRGLQGCYHPVPEELRSRLLEQTFALLTGGCVGR